MNLESIEQPRCVCGHGERQHHKAAGHCFVPGCPCHEFRHATKQNTRQAPPTGMPFPVCEQCRRQVARMTHRQDTEASQTVIKVVCHGEAEEIRLDNVPVPEGTELTPGRAFVRRKVGHDTQEVSHERL